MEESEETKPIINETVNHFIYFIFIFIFKSIYNNIYMYIKSIITRTVCGLACCVFPCLNLQAQEVVAYNDLTDLNLNITVNYGDQNLISHRREKVWSKL